MSNEYEISTIEDIFNLEQDQIERLCCELPRIMAYMKAVRATVLSLDDRGSSSLVMPLKWIDDGEQNIDIEIQCNGEYAADVQIRKNGEEK